MIKPSELLEIKTRGFITQCRKVSLDRYASRRACQLMLLIEACAGTFFCKLLFTLCLLIIPTVDDNQIRRMTNRSGGAVQQSCGR